MGFKYRVCLFLELQINEVQEHRNNERKKSENGGEVRGHAILVVSMVNFHIVDENRRVNRDEIPLLLEADSHNVESEMLNRYCWVMDNHHDLGFLLQSLNLLPTFCTYIYICMWSPSWQLRAKRGIRAKAAPQPDLRGFWPFSVWDCVFAALLSPFPFGILFLHFQFGKRKWTRMVHSRVVGLVDHDFLPLHFNYISIFI